MQNCKRILEDIETAERCLAESPRAEHRLCPCVDTLREDIRRLECDSDGGLPEGLCLQTALGALKLPMEGLAECIALIEIARHRGVRCELATLLPHLEAAARASVNEAAKHAYALDKRLEERARLQPGAQRW